MSNYCKKVKVNGKRDGIPTQRKVKNDVTARADAGGVVMVMPFSGGEPLITACSISLMYSAVDSIVTMETPFSHQQLSKPPSARQQQQYQPLEDKRIFTDGAG